MSDTKFWDDARFRCDGCGSIGTVDDGISEPGDVCPRSEDDDDPCDGTVHLMGRFYFYDDETGMERWHDGEFTAERCHDGVGQITRTYVSFDEWIATYPNADYAPED